MSERLGEALLDLDTNDRAFRQGIRRAERDAQGLGRVLDNVASRAAAIGRGLMAGAGVLGGSAIMGLASEWSDLQSQVNNAVGSMRSGEDAMSRIVAMARRTYSSITQTTNAYLQNSTALTELNYTTGQQLDLAETLNNALVISATRGQRAEAVMRAWSNALALGKLQGDSLNTVIQGSARLTKALADSMGVSTNELRKLGSEGKITTREMMGVTSQLGRLREEADAMPATPADAMVLIGNAALVLVGAMDKATGASGWLASELIAMANDIEATAKAWDDGTDPLLRFIRAITEAPDGFKMLNEGVEGTRSELEQLDAKVDDSRQAVTDFADEITSLKFMQDFAPHLPAAIQALIAKMMEGKATSEDTSKALIDLGNAHPNFSVMIGRLVHLISSLRTAEEAANDVRTALLYANSGGPTGDGGGRGALGQSRRARKEREAATDAYIAEQDRQVGLSREQLTLEQAITREKERAAAMGVKLGATEAERIARLRIAQAEAGKGGRSKAQAEAERNAEAVKDLIQNLQLELEVLRESDPVQKRMIELRETLAHASGKQREEIEGLITDLERESAAMANRQDAAEFFGQTIYDAFEGLIKGSQSAEDVLLNLADALSSAVLQAMLLGQGPLAGILGMQGADGRMGGLLGNLFGSLFAGFRAKGGLIPNGTFGIVGERGPEPVIGTSRGAMVLPNSSLSSRSSSGGTEITFVNQGTPQRMVESREEDDGNGGRRSTYVLEDMQGAGMTRPGSAAQKALRTMGVAPRVVRT